MSSIVPIPTSSIGIKFFMGITGLLLIGFVLGHMTGNLLIFMGPDAINEYGEFLQTVGHGVLIWVARIGLVAIFTIHMTLAFVLRGKNTSARPVPYGHDGTIQASWASRHMMLTGIVIFLFLVYHIAHFTVGAIDAANHKEVIARDIKNHFDIYTMVVRGFQQPLISGLYILAQLSLGLHLSHGAGSWLQSLGLARGWVRNLIVPLGYGVAGIIVVGNCSIPVSILLGWVK